MNALAFDHEHGKFVGAEQGRIDRLEPRHHLARDSQRHGQLGQQLRHPRPRRDDSGVRIECAAVGDDPHAAVARLDRAHRLDAQLGPGRLRQPKMGVEGRFHFEKAAVRLHHRNELRGHAKGRETPHQVGRGEHAMG